jgi:DNA repair exonuclease SbcCD ATPase subunit
MEETNQQSGGSKKVYVAIIILLLLINIVALVLLYSENKSKNDLNTAKAGLEQDVKKLNDTLDTKKEELEAFRGKNSELDSIINENEAQIEKQKSQISSLYAQGKMNKDELAKARQMISVDESAIADLQKKVEELTAQNKELTNQNQELNTNLNAEKQTTAQLNAQNAGLSKKVEIGSLFHLQAVTVEGLEVKKNGKEVAVKKVKQAEKLKIAFETGENKVLEAGTISLYVRILNPKGETISIADQGSGTIKDAASGQDVQYTKRADIDWQQQTKKVSMDWNLTTKDPGVYKVQIYQSGYVVGQAQVELK